MKFFINMHKINSLCIVVFLLTINLFSQSELNQQTVNDSIVSLSETDDVVDLFSISLSDDELNDDTSVSDNISGCLLYTSPSPRDRTRSRMPSSA